MRLHCCPSSAPRSRYPLVRKQALCGRLIWTRTSEHRNSTSRRACTRKGSSRKRRLCSRGYIASTPVHSSIGFPEVVVPVMSAMRHSVKAGQKSSGKANVGIIKTAVEQVEESTRWVRRDGGACCAACEIRAGAGEGEGEASENVSLQPYSLCVFFDTYFSLVYLGTRGWGGIF